MATSAAIINFRWVVKGSEMAKKSSFGRRLLKVLLVLLVLFFVAVVALVMFIGPIIKTAAEKIGPRVLGVPITVEKVDVNVFKGEIALKNLQVANPPGYSTDPLFALGDLKIAVSLKSLPGSGAIVVHEILLDNLRVSYEVVKGVPNVQVIQSKMTPAGVARTPESGAPEKPGRKIIIETLASRNGQVSVRTGLTLGKAVIVPLPPIEAHDIGRKSGGATVTEVVNNMMLEITKSVGRAVVDTLKSIVPGQDTLSKGAGTITDGVKSVTDKLKKLF
jgi:hypothetical protein